MLIMCKIQKLLIALLICTKDARAIAAANTVGKHKVSRSFNGSDELVDSTPDIVDGAINLSNGFLDTANPFRNHRLPGRITLDGIVKASNGLVHSTPETASRGWAHTFLGSVAPNGVVEVLDGVFASTLEHPKRMNIQSDGDIQHSADNEDEEAATIEAGDSLMEIAVRRSKGNFAKHHNGKYGFVGRVLAVTIENFKPWTLMRSSSVNGARSSLHVVQGATGVKNMWPPFRCHALLITWLPPLFFIAAYHVFRKYRQSIRQSLPEAEQRRRSSKSSATPRRGSLIISRGDEEQDGLQYSFLGSSIYYGMKVSVFVMHFVLFLLVLVAGFFDNKSHVLLNVGAILLATAGSPMSNEYSWNSLCTVFLCVFFPCVVFSLWFTVAESYIRVRLMLPAALKDAHAVNISRKADDEASGMPESTAETVKRIHMLMDACFKICSVEKGRLRQILPVQTVAADRFIEWHGLRCTWDNQAERFVATQTSPARMVGELHKRLEEGGLNGEEAQARLDLMGSNTIEVPVPGHVEAILNELSEVSYVYQLFFLYVFFFYGAVKNATIWTAVFVCSGLWKSLTMRHNRVVLRKSVSGSQARSYNVLRNGLWQNVQSSAIVPGDVISFSGSGELIPVDAYLVEGHLLLDESVLTGEATPVQKFPLSSVDPTLVKQKKDKKCYLYAGTTIMQGDETSRAVVTDTGVSTARGQLLMQMLYPKSLWIQFEEDYKIMFLWSFLFSVVMGFSIFIRAGVTPVNVIEVMFVLFNVFSPLLPVSLVMGQSQSAARLRSERGIICLTPARIAVAGRIDTVCFDKTGTLTEDGLEMIGCVPVSLNAFEASSTPVDLATSGDGLIIASALCHSLAMHGCQSELAGPQVELAMFRKSGASINYQDAKQAAAGPICHVTLPSGSTVLAQEKFPFDHNSMTMSVVLKVSEQVNIGAAASSRVALTKGAPESVAKLCVAGGSEGTLTTQKLLEASAELSHAGCYVLMVAFKSLDQTATVARKDIEVPASLHPLGLMVFRNSLRAESISLISALKGGELGVVMISGDSHHTAAAIAEQVGILDADTVLYSEVIEDDVVWRTSAGDGSSVLPLDSAQFVVSGDAWAILQNDNNNFGWLQQARVFGRVSPEQKSQIINTYIKSGRTAMFVGDGGNDSAALRAAHVGLALTETSPSAGESGCSVIAHFNTTAKEPSATLQILQEGRCALTTSFGCFTFLASFGLQLSAIKVIWNWNPKGPLRFSGWQLIFLEGIALPLLTYAMVQSRPRGDLSTKKPAWSLVGKKGVLALWLPFLFNVALSIIVLQALYGQEWFFPFDMAAKKVEEHQVWRRSDNWESETLFLVWASSVLAAAYANSFGGSFRLPVYMNAVLNFSVGFLLAVLVVLLWRQRTLPNCMFRINCDTRAIQELNVRSDALKWLEAVKGESDAFYGMGPSDGNVMPAPWQITVLYAMSASFVTASLLQKTMIEPCGE